MYNAKVMSLSYNDNDERQEEHAYLRSAMPLEKTASTSQRQETLRICQEITLSSEAARGKMV